MNEIAEARRTRHNDVLFQKGQETEVGLLVKILKPKRTKVMPFDPDCAALVTRLRELNLPRYETMTPLQAREAMAAARKAAAMVPPAIAEARDIVAETSEGSLHARLYRPGSDAESRPTLVFFHGGGWVLGDLDSHDILCRRLSIAGKSNVIAFDYRLAPENKFPAAVNDAIAAVKWIAPVTAIRGNVDTGDWAGNYADTELVRLAGRSIYVLHDLKKLPIDPVADGIDVIVSGHSHKAAIEIVNGILYLNPGSAGPRRFKLSITLATLDIWPGGLRPIIHDLEEG